MGYLGVLAVDDLVAFQVLLLVLEDIPLIYEEGLSPSRFLINESLFNKRFCEVVIRSFEICWLPCLFSACCSLW